MARNAGAGAGPNAGPAALEFEAKLVGVKPVIGSFDDYGNSKAGRLEVTFAIAQPAAPKKPVPNYEIASGLSQIKPRPEVPAEAKKGESVVTFEKRKAEAEADQVRYDRALERYNRELASWDQAMAALSARMLSYAQLVGLTAVFGNTELRVVVHPKTRLLEGFGVSLLAAPAAGEAGPEQGD